MTMSLRTRTCLAALALTAATTTTACKVGDEPTGGDGETGDGDGDCPLGSPGPTTLEFSVSLTSALVPVPLDEPCTVTSVSGGATTVLGLDCLSADVELSVTAEPALDLPAEVGDEVSIWLYDQGYEFAPSWLRLDFPRFNGTLFLIEADQLGPPGRTYFPAPYGLGYVDACAPIDDGCLVIQPDQLGIEFLGSPIALWAGEYDSLELSEARVEFWSDRSETVLGVGPLCDPSPDLFLSHRLMIAATSPHPVKGEVCDPGETNPCATGLHCCYPCGIEGCDFVCTPEDMNTLECPLPPP